jgi:hypothetical protein
MTGGARGEDFWKKEKGRGRLGRLGPKGGRGRAAGPPGRPTAGGRAAGPPWGPRGEGKGAAGPKGEKGGERKRKGFSFSNFLIFLICLILQFTQPQTKECIIRHDATNKNSSRFWLHKMSS